MNTYVLIHTTVTRLHRVEYSRSVTDTNAEVGHKSQTQLI